MKVILVDKNGNLIPFKTRKTILDRFSAYVKYRPEEQIKFKGKEFWLLLRRKIKISQKIF